jgi:hypothetical protein
MADALAPFAGQKWEVTPYWEMKQSLDLANRIYLVLNKAGWTYLPPKRGTWLMGGIRGVLVSSDPKASARTRAAAAALVKALNGAGIQADTRDKGASAHPDEVVTLSVGSKPLP